ncbi:MAG: hypothetical protein OEZ22_14115 [Spirochaetia bacterium]|nr:hypothetical protein [Spirochaetia bacterium]
MRKKCSKPDCPAPKGLCIEQLSNDFPKCQNWLGTLGDQSVEKQKRVNIKSQTLPWTGEPFQPSDIEIVSQRSVPLIIGMVGSAEAGKTSYLGMLYTLLFNGFIFEDWSFAGSCTLSGWETLAQYLKIKPDGNVEFAPTTPANPDYYSLYHLALKRGDLFRDVLFADSSGEVFNLWAEDVKDQNAENARWIYEKSNAFIFMVDSMALIERSGAAKNEIMQMAEQVAANLKGRPVVVVWAKADVIDKIRENIKIALSEDLSQVFGDSQIFEVSNFSKTDPDILCHKNNLAVTEYLLTQLNEPKVIKLVPQISSVDLFLNYRGVYGNE